MTIALLVLYILGVFLALAFLSQLSPHAPRKYLFLVGCVWPLFTVALYLFVAGHWYRDDAAPGVKVAKPKRGAHGEQPTTRMPLELAERNIRAATKAASVHTPDGWGVAVFMFSIGPVGYLTWGSNVRRGDAIKSLREWLATKPEDREYDHAD